MPIPPGVSERDWTSALQEFETAVGRQWVFTSDEDVALYRDAYSPLWGEPEERLASAAIAPDTTEQVSQVMRTANRFRIPIYPIATGKNLGYGGNPGTAALLAKYMGALPGLVEDRTDLTPQAIRFFVRNGISIMPFFRKTEVSDEDLDAMVAYLTRPRAADAGRDQAR